MNAQFLLGGLCAVIVAVCPFVGAGRVAAQNNQFTERSFVSSPAALGMGDAGVALPGAERGFFYNPAHFPHASSHFTILGMQGSVSPSFIDQIHFFNQRLNPAVEAGQGATADVAALRQEAERLRRRPGRGAGTVVLPNFVYSTGPVGIGGGLFTKTTANYRIDRAPMGQNEVWMSSRTDIMAVLGMGLDLRVLGLPGLSVGVTGTQTRRFLAFKNKPLSQFEPKEYAVLLQGSTRQIDAGLVYRVGDWWPASGTLRVGGAVYDVLRTDYNYVPGGTARLPFVRDIVDESGAGERADPEEVDRARRLFSLRPSYRVGAAYEGGRVLFMEDVEVALDMQGYGTGTLPVLSRLHLGAQATVVSPVTVRAGVNGGYPSGGIGVAVGALHVDYGVRGVEGGTQFRGRRSYVHTARLLLRLE